jgi:RNA polymerase-binding transcription factor DksA
LCVDCHGAIPFERLRLEPQALRCVACQSFNERNSLS